MLQIPERLLRDRYWRGMLYLFSEHHKLNRCFTTEYFDFDDGIVNVKALKEKAKPWSDSEKFMLDLAMHLFNPNNKVDLSGMDYLDEQNKQLAIEAIGMRYA
jgi:hypothetical protein